MKWSKDKVRELKKLVDAGLKIKEIADILNTTYDSVACKMKTHNFTSKATKVSTPKTTEEDTSNIIKVKKADRGEFIRDLGDRLVEHISQQSIILPEVKLRQKSTNKKEEYSVLDLSDIHYGMINECFDSKIGKQRVTYNKDIFKKEMSNLYKSVGEIHELLSSAYKLRKLYINIMGDIVTNDRIFQGQEFHIDGCVGKQLDEVNVHLITLINNFLRFYEQIEVNCVVGNHGRSTDSYKTDEPVENNFEYHLYRIIQRAFEGKKRVKIVVPSSYEHIVNIGPWKHLIAHGDKFRGATKNSIERQVKDLIVNMGNFDALDMGHFHFCGQTPVGEAVSVFHNGCWIEKDNYAFRVFKQYSVPAQHFYGCNDKRKLTWGYELDLR
jgi:hypothetical protein